MEHLCFTRKINLQLMLRGGDEFNFRCSPPAISQKLHRTGIWDLSIIPPAQRKKTGTHKDLSIILSAIKTPMLQTPKTTVSNH